MPPFPTGTRRRAMSEADWREGRDLRTMLDRLKDQARPRKFRLYACACLHQLRDRTPDAHFRRTALLAERFVEGDVGKEEFRAAFRRAWPNGWERARVAALVAIDPMDRDLCYWRCLELADEIVGVLRGPTNRRWHTSPARDPERGRKEQIALVHEVFGAPEGLAFDPAWRTREVADLAESIAAESALEAL